MAACAGEVSVFADTNLGTHIAMNVPLEITAGAFKSKEKKKRATILMKLLYPPTIADFLLSC